MDSPTTYSLHGLTLSSEVPLDEPAVEGDTSDIVVRLGEPHEIPEVPPEGDVVAELVREDQRFYTVSAVDDRLLIRFPGLAEFDMSPGARNITARSAPSVDPRVLSVLLPGTVLAVYLNLIGKCVLHASAVEADGGAVVFTGLSGMGKSTCAAMACALGARLVTDDALVVERAERPAALPGTSHVRLREVASSIIDAYPARPRTWETVDHRVALAPARSIDKIPIWAIVIPRPSRGAVSLELTRLEPSASVARLLAFTRVPGWSKKEVVRDQFMQVAHLVNRVPVFEAAIPWGPPFDLDPMRELLDRLIDGEAKT